MTQQIGMESECFYYVWQWEGYIYCNPLIVTVVSMLCLNCGDSLEPSHLTKYFQSYPKAQSYLYSFSGMIPLIYCISTHSRTHFCAVCSFFGQVTGINKVALQNQYVWHIFFQHWLVLFVWNMWNSIYYFIL